MIAVDGTRLKAVNNRQRNLTKAKLANAIAESDERLNRYLKQLNDADKDDTSPIARVDKLEQKIAAIKQGRARLDEYSAALDASDEAQISLTDPDARAMHSSSGIGIGHVNRRACRDCVLRSRCTNGKFRKVTRFANEAILDRMAVRLSSNPEVLDQHRECVEHTFGSIKQWMGQKPNTACGFTLFALERHVFTRPGSLNERYVRQKE